MSVIITLAIVIPAVMFSIIVIGFIIAGISDRVIASKRKRDIFYQLSRDHNRVKVRARK